MAFVCTIDWTMLTNSLRHLQVLQLPAVCCALRGREGQLRAQRPGLQGHGHGQSGLLRHGFGLRLLREKQWSSGRGRGMSGR